jgi:TRAP-type C4-dicarboxylate transport system substrate-binding protein
MSVRRKLTFAGALVAALALAAATWVSASAQPVDPTRPVILRLASVAPKGSSWGNDIDRLGREIELATRGRVKVKVYLSGSAGDELSMSEHVKKGQLDAVVSAGWLCDDAIPTMRALGLIGVFQSREEAAAVTAELKPTLEAEAARSGFTLLGTAGIGSIMIFSRNPLTSMAELRKTKLWRWEGETVQLAMGKAMGLDMVSTRLEDGGKTYDQGAVDGFFAVPMAALAFQWFAQTRYITDLRTGYLMGCFVVSSRAFDALPGDAQAALREAGAKLVVRVEDTGRREDDALMNGIFQKQGLKKVAVSERFRAEFFDAARVAREKLGDKLVPKDALGRVLEALTDYRSEHH